jgi:hypothetical protein
VKELHVTRFLKLENEIIAEGYRRGSSEALLSLRKVKEDVTEENKENEVNLSQVKRKDNQLTNQFAPKQNKYYYQSNSELETEEIKEGNMLIPTRNFENQLNREIQTLENENRIANQNQIEEVTNNTHYQSNSENSNIVTPLEVKELHADVGLSSETKYCRSQGCWVVRKLQYC